MYRLRTFGQVALYENERRLDGAFAQHRRLALLALLATASGGVISRDKLLGVLWPESDEERARHSLSQMIFVLRRDSHGAELIQGTAELSLNPQLIGSDVGDFAAAIRAGDADAAVALYEGAFLDGFHLGGSAEFSNWADSQRARFAREWREALERVARARSASGDAPGAAQALTRLADCDRCDANIALMLARAHLAAGDPATALGVLRMHATLVRQDLGIEPSAEVLLLMEDVKQGRATAAPIATARHVPAREAEAVVLTRSEDEPRRPPPMGDEQRPRRQWAKRWWIAAAAVLLLIGAVYEIVPEQIRATNLVLLTRRAAAAVPRRIVVAPLENRTGDDAFGALGEMAADWITQQLVRTGEFDVVDARTSFATAKVVDAMPRWLRGERAMALARETRAAYLLSGRYYRDGDSLRAVVYLSDVAAGEVRRSVGPISGPATSPTQVVSPLTRFVVAAAVSQVDTGTAGIIIGLNAPPSYEAYREASHAWESFYRGDYDGLYAHVRRAMQLDSGYMAPLEIEAFVRSEMFDWGRMAALVSRIDAHRDQLTPAERAGLQVMQAQLRGDVDGELAMAQDLARAVPSAMEVRTHIARLAVNANRADVAIATLDAVDPERGVMLVAPWYWNWRTAALHELGRHGEELTDARRGLRQFPEHPSAMLNVGRALAALGRADELRILADRLAAAPPAEQAAILLTWARELRAHDHAGDAPPLVKRALNVLENLADTSSAVMNVRVAALTEAGQLEHARGVAQRMLAIGVDDIGAHGWLGIIAARSGDRLAATHEESTLAQSKEPYPMGRSAMWRARIAASLHMREVAVGLAQSAWSEGYVRYFDPGNSRFDEPDLHADPAFLPLRDYEPFRKLVAPRR